MSENQVVDLSAFMPEDTALFEVLDPGGTKATGWVIEFAGPSHPKTVEWANKNAKEQLRREAQMEAARVNQRKYKPDEKEPDEVRRANVEWVVSRIVSWTPVRIPHLSPDTIEFSEKAASDLLMRPEMGWAYLQMVEFLADIRSFTKGSVTN